MADETLAGDEWDLICDLRGVPDGIARDQLLALMHDLVASVRDPRCTRAQADGVPCVSVSGACADCQQSVGLAESLLRRA